MRHSGVWVLALHLVGCFAPESTSITLDLVTSQMPSETRSLTVTVYDRLGAVDGSRRFAPVSFPGRVELILAKAQELRLLVRTFEGMSAVARITPTAPMTITLELNESLDDTDHDGVPDLIDNCSAIANVDQRDSDADGVGDACPNGIDSVLDGGAFGDFAEKHDAGPSTPDLAMPSPQPVVLASESFSGTPLPPGQYSFITSGEALADLDVEAGHAAPGSMVVGTWGAAGSTFLKASLPNPTRATRIEAWYFLPDLGPEPWLMASARDSSVVSETLQGAGNAILRATSAGQLVLWRQDDVSVVEELVGLSMPTNEWVRLDLCLERHSGGTRYIVYRNGVRMPVTAIDSDTQSLGAAVVGYNYCFDLAQPYLAWVDDFRVEELGGASCPQTL